MSGLFAIRPSDPKCLKSSLVNQRTRGPDKSFSYICNDIGISVNVLRTKKRMRYNTQPVFSKTKKTLCVFDGYILNAQKVISEFSLEADPDDFGSLIVELFEKKGKSFVDYIEGGFAIILIDIEGKNLIVTRDMIGIKQLYWAKRKGKTVFSSCLTAIPPEFYPTVETFPPGLVWIDNNFEHTIKKKVKVSKNIEKVLLLAIDKHIPQDVPWGLSLCGGVDSSIIAAMANRLGHNFNCYVFDAGLGEDEQAASTVAASLGLKLKIIKPTKAEIINILPKLIKVLCSYRAEIILGAILSYFVAREASKDGLKVLLTGEGVDVIFGGMPKYSILKPTKEELRAMMIEDQNSLWRATNRRMDHSAMLSSIEPRAPFEDLNVIYSARTIPKLLLVDESNDLKDKILLRLIAKKYLPNDLNKRAKATISQGTGLDMLVREIAEDLKYKYKIKMVDLEKFQLKHRSGFELICFCIWKNQYPEMAQNKESLVARNLFPVSYL